MTTMSPVEMTRRVNRFLGGLPGVLRKAAKAVAARITARSVGTFMQDARGGGRRAATDRGPIRIVSGNLARAMNNSPGAGGIERITTGGARALLTKGVDPQVAPGAYNEGRIAKSERDLSFLRPAARAELAESKRIVGRIVTGSLRKSLRGAAGGSA